MVVIMPQIILTSMIICIGYDRNQYIIGNTILKNILNCISFENDIQLTYHERERIYKVFVEIDSVLNEVNDGRKRMIKY